ncbi:MAG: transcriptional repressor of sporulation and degradative enzyme production [Paenibacillus sp.]|nr:transcriptional repressor of sporulation and degradative enzyme production [Paenibacillus sp.]
MYTPKHFQMEDPQRLTAFIQQHSFGTLFSQTDGELCATHLPFLLEQDRSGQWLLLGHMAKANPHWTTIGSGGEVLVVFQGPHAYISPGWYEERAPAVPTWNYVAVHAHGEFSLIEEPERLRSILQQSIERYESKREQPWRTDLGNDFNRQLMNAIVGFAIKINRMEGKWKLSQNHAAERRKRVIDGLRTRKDAHAHEIADLMEQTLTGSE